MKIILINPFGIGDVLFTTPLIRELKTSLPGTTISYWCNERVESILEDNPHLDKIFALSRGDLKKIFQGSALEGIKKALGLFWAIKKEKFDIALDFSLDHRYGLAAKIIGIKRRIGYDYKNRGRFLTHKISIEGFSQKHIAEYYLQLLDFFGITPKNNHLEIFSSKKDQAKAKAILKRSGLKENKLNIGIAPGAGQSWGKDANLKHWPALKYAQLADKISENSDVNVLILGDASEKPITEVIVSAMKNKPIDLTEKTSLKELKAVIFGLNLLITNDGGPLHMAVAAGIRTISIFGPVDEKIYGPYPPSEMHIVVKNKDINCRPCYKNFRFPGCVNERECIEGISVEEVYDRFIRSYPDKK